MECSNRNGHNEESDTEWEQNPPLGLRRTADGFIPMNKIWKTPVTESIIRKHGVMHLPIEVGASIPEELKRVVVVEERTGRSYNMRVTYAKRNAAEKHISGKQWRKFLADHNVRVGHQIACYMGSWPIVITACLYDDKGERLKAPVEKIRKKSGRDEEMGSTSGVTVKEEMI